MFVIGRISKQPVFRVSQNTKMPFLKFQVECDKGVGMWPERVGVTIFGKLAEQLNSSLTIGVIVGMSGDCQVRGYLDKMQQPRGAQELIAKDVTILQWEQPKPEPQQAETLMGGSPTVADQYTPSFSDDDIPF